MSFEMTPAEAQQYGDSLSFWQKLALLQAYAPLIGYLQKFATEGDPFKRGLIIADACEWLASKTTNRIDDEAVRHIAAVLKTPEGEALVRWVLLQIEARALEAQTAAALQRVEMEQTAVLIQGGVAARVSGMEARLATAVQE